MSDGMDGWDGMVIIGHRSFKSIFSANNTRFSEEMLFSISDCYKTTAMDSSNKIVTQRVTHKIFSSVQLSIFSLSEYGR